LKVIIKNKWFTRLSAVHLEIIRFENEVKLIDRSTNGCYINNVKMVKDV
jgi:hypothetical protein